MTFLRKKYDRGVTNDIQANEGVL